MTQLIPESWQQTLVHVRDNIRRAIDRSWHRHPPEVKSGQAEVVRHDGTLWAPSRPFLGTPGLNVEETDGEFIVTEDVPELKRDDYTVEISDERLVVRAEQKQPSERHDCDDDSTERSYSAFMRIMPLPRDVDAEHAQAQYKSGILRVTLPKTAQARSRRVKVQVRG
jgi:HSP20 family protein